jgi:hypothetical protein
LDSLPREEYILTVFKNRVPRRVFEPDRQLVTESERKLNTEELHNLQPTFHQILLRYMNQGRSDG